MAEPSARKTIASILRQDAGTESAGSRLAQLAWLVFLKALDDRETENEILDERYRSPIPERLRWRSWAAGDGALSGDELLRFIDAELIPGLAELPPHRGEAGAVVRDASRVVASHARSGALLRRAIERLSEVDFNSLPARRSFQDELALAVSEAGERFVPPALARFIVEALDPELGEAVLDPSCMAGALLTAVVERIRDRWVRSPQHEAMLQRSIGGTEPTELGWLLSTVNLLLHGLVVPSQVRREDAMLRPFQEYGPGDRADVILSVPPFDGAVAEGVLESLPPGLRTTDASAGHVVLAMHLLRPFGRAALVVPDGVLSANGVVARIRERLLEECELDTIVRLPAGVFAPATNVKTNVLFFTQGRPTREVWCYEHLAPEGLRAYSKRRPLQEGDLAPLRAWWSRRVETDRAFQITVDDIKAREFNLDRASPRLYAAGIVTEIATPPARQADVTAGAATPPPVRPSPITASMRLLTLRLRDFRGFAKLDLALPTEGPLVLIGVNGAGKSTVLEAIAMLLSPFVTLASGLALRQADVQIAVDDVQVGKPLATVEAAFTIDGVEHYWSLHANRVKGSVAVAPELGHHAKALAERLRVGRTANLPVLCAYSAGRGLGEGGGGKRPTYGSPHLEAYDRAFRRGLGPYQDFLRWFREEEDAENYARVHDDPAYRNPRLEVVRRALSGFLRELGADLSDLQMRRSDTSAPGRPAKPALLTLKKGDVLLRIEQLSDGERNTLLLVADLARRLAMANPARTDPLQGDGIVLIDDLERDLHPGWQRAFLPTLSATFPGCQIIVTTHSPQVLSRIHKENVFIFENFDLVRVTPHTYGRDSNSILGEVMGLPERPADVQEKIRQASILIDEERLDEAKAALAELTSILGDDDNVLVRFRTLVSFLEDVS